MTTAADILDFLRQAGETVEHPRVRSGLAVIEVLGVKADQSATRGDLAWISARNAKRSPERIDQFGGSVLIGPALLDAPAVRDHPLYIPCADPKTAFTKVLHQFFGHLAMTAWPAGPGPTIAPDAVVGERASIAPGVVIGAGVSIGNDIVIGPNTCIANARIADRVTIGANCSIGLAGFGYAKDASGSYSRFPHVGSVVIEADVEIGSNTCIDRGSLGETVIGAGTKIDNLVHVAHNVIVGRNAMLIANAMIGGSTEIGAQTWVAPSVSVRDAVTIGDGAILGMGAVVLKNVPENAVFIGNPARPLERRPKE